MEVGAELGWVRSGRARTPRRRVALRSVEREREPGAKETAAGEQQFAARARARVISLMDSLIPHGRGLSPSGLAP
eukprot:11176430-Lingulodinium_polyedra.AAC.1